MLFDDFCKQVDQMMFRKFGITWNDASGDMEKLQREWKDGETPDNFTDWFGNKYDLERREDILFCTEG